MPQNTTGSRLNRIRDENWEYLNHRRALPTLLLETSNRCAYSQQHIDDFGDRVMEVDHFNPKQKGKRKDRHGDLLCASRHCNGVKWKRWPTSEEVNSGARFLNPYKEVDYGVHIVEVVETGRLLGLTQAGKYHVRHLGLNAEFLVKARLRRTKSLAGIKRSDDCVAQVEALTRGPNKLVECLQIGREALESHMKIAIPVIPAAPASITQNT